MNSDSIAIPKLFRLGDKRYEKEYKELSEQYSNSLLHVHFNNMVTAREHWKDIVRTIDNYALENDVDIEGLKIWAHIFFSEDGEIDYFGYYLKPNSEIKDQKMLEDLIATSLNQYKYDGQLRGKGNHYSGMGFPIFRR
ncbi:MAG: hypothetical protein AAF573_21105 [Bacteroidota bacterium]